MIYFVQAVDGGPANLDEGSDNLIVCRICNMPKSPSEFESDARMKSGIRTECHACHKAAKLAAYHRRKGEIAARRKAIYDADPIPYRLKALDTYYRCGMAWSERRRQYRRAHPEKNRAYNHARRAALLKSIGHHDAGDIRSIFNRQRGHCFWCGVKLAGDFEVDHVIPLTRGGANYPENIVIACCFCNRSKHNKLPSEWRHANRSRADRQRHPRPGECA